MDHLNETMTNLEIGGIYLTEWDERPARIIGFDDIEVFYDCLWPHDNSWTFSGNFKKKCYFYRTSSQLFAEKSKKQDHQPLTNEEKRFFRPDLLMRVGRIKELSWHSFEQKTIHEFENHLNNTLNAEAIQQKLEANEIVVLPFGQKGGIKKGEKLTANNDEYFTLPELIWKSKSVQESAYPAESNGIGLYRIGFEKGLPSYYIGEYFDKAGLIKE